MTLALHKQHAHDRIGGEEPPPAPLPNQGIADRLEEAKAALASRYEQVKRGAAVSAIASGSQQRIMSAIRHRSRVILQVRHQELCLAVVGAPRCVFRLGPPLRVKDSGSAEWPQLPARALALTTMSALLPRCRVRRPGSRSNEIRG
jgi:hypothetical protein